MTFPHTHQNGLETTLDTAEREEHTKAAPLTRMAFQEAGHLTTAASTFLPEKVESGECFHERGEK